MFCIIVSLERRRHWKIGQTTFAYVALYTLGRFAFENMRIDFARKIGPLRFNAWVSVFFFIVGVVGFLYYRRNGKDWPVQADGTAGPLIPGTSDSDSEGEAAPLTGDPAEYEGAPVTSEGQGQ